MIGEPLCPLCTAMWLAGLSREGLIVLAAAQAGVPDPDGPEVSDAELLAACRAGGPHGVMVYRLAAAQWRRQDRKWREDRAARLADEIADALQEAAGDVVEVLILRGEATQGELRRCS